MKEIHIRDNSLISFHKLFIKKEEDHYLVGRDEIKKYIEIPKEGHLVLVLLQNKKSLEQVKKIVDQEFKEDVNVKGFLRKLISLGFVKSIDGIPIEDRFQKKRNILQSLKKEHISWLFSKYSFIVFLAIALTALGIILFDQQYLPNFLDFFWHPVRTVALLTSFLLGWVLVLGHESFHLLAAKSIGAGGTLRISNRLNYLVAETDVSELWKFERKKRYLVYLAGMMFDILFISVAILILFISDKGLITLPVIAYKIIKLLILLEVLSIAWEFRLYMKTDIYYVLANFFKCKNLYRDSLANIKNLFAKIFKNIKPIDLSIIPAKEMRIVRIYPLILIIGSVITLLPFFAFILPIAVKLIYESFINIVAGPVNITAFFDGLVVMGINLFYLSMLGYSVFRKIKLKKITEIAN